MLANCTTAVTDAVMVERVPAQGNTGFPVSVTSEAMYNSDPVKHEGMMSTMTGSVPNMIWRIDSLMIPHNTEVCRT